MASPTRAPILVVGLALGACSTPAPPAPRNVAAPSATLRLAASAPLGSLALAPATTHDGWIPVATASAVAPGSSVPAGTSVTAIGTGAAVQLTAGPATRLPYGCDNNQIDVVPLAGPRIAPGVVWLLPAGAAWTPTALPITSSRTPAASQFTIGPLTLDLRRRDAVRGTLTITRAGRAIYTAPFERGAMEGADASPIDLTEDGPGIPQPVAAWALAPRGPVLVVLLQPGYEGVTLAPVLVEVDAAREVEAMSLYLYRCAF